VAEGWHGQRFGRQIQRTREYVAVVRKALARERLEFHGETIDLPLPDGPGKALKLMVHPVREQVPIYLAAVGPKNLELAGEIADGWLAVFYSPKHADEQLGALRAGAERAGRAGLDGFDVVPTVPLNVGADVATCADPIRPYAALYVGGMGSREKNFYNALARRYGYEEAAQTVQDAYLSHDYAGAMAAVPLEFIDETSLLGPVERVADGLQAYAAAGATTVSIAPTGATLEERVTQLRACAEALDRAGVGE
jgi:F420-dependent oxidoreductase-like protein